MIRGINLFSEPHSERDANRKIFRFNLSMPTIHRRMYILNH